MTINLRQLRDLEVEADRAVARAVEARNRIRALIAEHEGTEADHEARQRRRRFRVITFPAALGVGVAAAKMAVDASSKTVVAVAASGTVAATVVAAVYLGQIGGGNGSQQQQQDAGGQPTRPAAIAPVRPHHKATPKATPSATPTPPADSPSPSTSPLPGVDLPLGDSAAPELPSDSLPPVVDSPPPVADPTHPAHPAHPAQPSHAANAHHVQPSALLPAAPLAQVDVMRRRLTVRPGALLPLLGRHHRWHRHEHRRWYRSAA